MKRLIATCAAIVLAYTTFTWGCREKVNAAQIVCIAKGTVRPDLCDVGDIVDTHEDGVGLDTENGYLHFKVIRIPGWSLAKLRGELAKRVPVQQFDKRNRHWIWRHSDGKWYVRKTKPKYELQINVTTAQLSTLGNVAVDDKIRMAVLAAATSERLSDHGENLETEVEPASAVIYTPDGFRFSFREDRRGDLRRLLDVRRRIKPPDRE